MSSSRSGLPEPQLPPRYGLIDIAYWDQFPALLWVSPHLAVLDRQRANASERLLAKRSREVFEAMKENTRLKLELLEAEARETAKLSGTDALTKDVSRI